MHRNEPLRAISSPIQEVFAAAWAEGRAMPLGEAIADALDDA
jgi:hypothetical protein